MVRSGRAAPPGLLSLMGMDARLRGGSVCATYNIPLLGEDTGGGVSLSFPPAPPSPAQGKVFYLIHEPTRIITRAMAAKTKKVPSTSDSLKKRRAMRCCVIRYALTAKYATPSRKAV